MFTDESSEPAPPQSGTDAGGDVAEALVLRIVSEHADSLLRVARRYSLCADDAHDAYQRALEILLRHAHRLDPDRADGWVHTVVKHEALAINRSRRLLLGREELDAEALEARTAASPEDQALVAERVTRTAEALHHLKPQEVRALWLRALGHSYAQIADSTGWTYTKVNRCLAEGRRSFLDRYAGIEAGAECERLAPALSALVDGEADTQTMLDIRAHLRGCGGCRATVRGLHDAAQPLGVVLPAALVVAEHVHLSPAGGLFERVYEGLTVTLNDRAAHAVMRAQVVVDAVASYKLTAVAASAAAVAGGGIAVEGALDAGVSPAAIVRRAEGASAPPPTVLATARATVTQSAASRSRTRSHTKPAAKRSASNRAIAKRSASQRRARGAAGTGAPDATSAAAPSATRPRTTSAATTRAARSPSSSAAGGSVAKGSAASEFGFE